VIILRGIFAGIFTATEAAAAATVYHSSFRSHLQEIGSRICTNPRGYGGHDRVVSLLVGAATASRGSSPRTRSAHARGLHHRVGGGRTPLLFSIAVFLFFGMILDGCGILIFFPILMPIALSWGGAAPLRVLVIAIVGIAIVAPPIGLCLVILCSLTKIKLTTPSGR